MRLHRVTAVVAAALAGVSCGSRPPRPGPTLDVAASFGLRSLDPHAENTFGPFQVLANVYEGLVAFDGQLRVRPALAASWESPDPTTWVFHLRKGVRFASGQPLEAADVVASLERVQREPGLEMRGHLPHVASVEALDAETVRVRTSRPTPLLLNHLTFVAIVPRGASDLRRAADGTGPFRVESWAAGEVRLRRNDQHWEGPPALEALVFHTERAAEEAAQGLLDRRYHLATFNTRRFEAVLARAPHLRLARQQNLFLRYLGLDVGRAVTPYCPVTPNPFQRQTVRLALDLAIDRRDLVAGLGTGAAPASQLVPRTIFGFDPSLPEPQPDLAAARRLLAEAGLGAGFPVALHTRERYAEAARRLAGQLSHVRLQVEVRVVPDSEFFRALAAGDVTLWLSGFGCPLGDASELLENAMHSRDEARGLGFNNYGGFRDGEVDRAIEEAASLTGMGERRSAIQSLMSRLAEERPWLPLYFDEDLHAVDRRFDWEPRTDGYLLGREVRPAASR